METAFSVLACIVGVSVVVACVVLGLRHSRRSVGRLQAVVSGYERVLGGLAGRAGMRLQGPEPHVHPVVGAIPAWPSAVGRIDGVDVAIDVEAEGGDSPVVVRTRLRFGAPAGTQIRGSLRGATFRLPRGRDRLASEVQPPLAAELATLAGRIDVGDADVAVLARPTPGQHSGMDYEFKLALDVDELERLVRAGVALVRQLAG